MAREIVERAGQAVDGRLGHLDRQRRLGGDAVGQRHRRGERRAILRQMLDEPPLERLLGLDALGREDDGLLGARGPHQLQHPRDRAPAHAHAERHLGNAEVGAARADAEIERHRQRRPAADAKPLDRGDRHLLHLVPGAAHARADRDRAAQRPEPFFGSRLALAVLEIEARRERARAPRQHDNRRLEIVLERARRRPELPHRRRRQRVDRVAAVEPHQRHPPVRAQAALDRDMRFVCHGVSYSLIEQANAQPLEYHALRGQRFPPRRSPQP